MPLPFLVQLAILIVIQIVAYALTPKPKSPKPDSSQQLDSPKIGSGPLRVVFGTMWIKDPDIIWFGDKGQRQYEVKA